MAIGEAEKIVASVSRADAHVLKCDPALAYKHPGPRPYQEPTLLSIS